MDRMTTEGAMGPPRISSNNPYMIMISRPMSMEGMTTERKWTGTGTPPRISSNNPKIIIIIMMLRPMNMEGMKPRGAVDRHRGPLHISLAIIPK